MTFIDNKGECMVMMPFVKNNINEFLFELIRVAIGVQEGLSRMPSESEWLELYKMANSQSLVGVCFAGLQRLGANMEECYARIGMNEMQYMHWMGMAVQIQQKNEVVNRQCVELQESLSANGYRSYIMKGQSNASLYGDLSIYRQSGDIDIYLEGGVDRVLACAKTFSEPDHVNELEMHVKVFDGTDVEFHYRPFIMRNPRKNRRLQDFFKSQEEACFANRIQLEDVGMEITAPTTAFNLVHQMVHIHLHLFTEGVGLRQLMDYYYVLCDCQLSTGSSELARVKRTIHNLGLDRFASALMWNMEYVFGLPRGKMLWVPDEKDGRFLLDEVMASGNFGKHNAKQLEKKSRTGYGFWALFIRNLRLSRFDRWDWFWGPLWRVYHFVWRTLKWDK